MTSEPDVATEQQQQQQAVTAAAKPPAAAAAVVRTAGPACAPGDDEDEGCGDTHASDDEADGVGLTAAAGVETVLEPGQRAGNRPVKQVLGKRKADRNAAVGTGGRQTSAADGSKQQQQQDQLVGEAVPAVSRAGGSGAAAAASAPPAGAISDRSSPAPTAVPAASHDSTHGPAAAAGAVHGSQDSLQAVVGAVAAVAPISARSDATAAAALVPAGGAVGITFSAVSQQEATGAGAAAVTSSAASQEGGGAVGAMHAPRPRKMLRGLSMTRTKSVPMDLCVMEVASTASSKPKGLMG